MVVDGELRAVQHGIEHLKAFALSLRDTNVDVCVLETYRISARPELLKAHIGSDVPTLQVIGMIRMWCWEQGIELVKQQPKDKTMAEKVQPELIREIRAGLPLSHDESHDGDALLHLGLYWYRNHFAPTKEPA